LLTKYQNDLLSAEGQVVEKLYSSVYKKVDKVDRLCARVISPSSYVLQGESYKADVMVAAYNSTQDPEVFIGQFTPAVKKDGNGNFIMTTSKSDAVPLLNPVKINVEQGLGKLTMPGNATGNTKYSGVIRVKTTDGDYKFFPFEGEYQVGEKTAVVSPQKMNVLYVGLDNPVDISVPGVAQKDIIAVFDGDGRLVQNSDGSFKALVSKPGNTKVKVSARVDGKVIAMGEKAFRIKRVPNPVTTLDGILQSGSARGTMLEQRTGVVAKSDEFVYGDIPWQVKRYTVTIHKGTELQKIDNVGAALCTKARELMKGLKKGDAVFIDDVIAAGPDKNDRKIGSLAFNITMQ
jgi:gliding motility-associated protein GldM